MKLNKLRIGTVLAITAIMIGGTIPIKSNAQEIINQYDTMLSENDDNEKKVQVEISDEIKDKVSQEEINTLIDEAKDGESN